MVCRREVRLDVHASLWEDILTTGLNVAQAGGDLLGELLSRYHVAQAAATLNATRCWAVLADLHL